MRYCFNSFTLVPLIIACIFVIWSISNLAQAASSSSVVPSPSATDASKLITGNKIALSAGMVQERSAGPLSVPAKNHIRPLWLFAQFFPVLSTSGFLVFAIDRTHCHHLAVHSAYVLPNGLESGANNSKPL